MNKSQRLSYLCETMIDLTDTEFEIGDYDIDTETWGPHRGGTHDEPYPHGQVEITVKELIVKDYNQYDPQFTKELEGLRKGYIIKLDTAAKIETHRVELKGEFIVDGAKKQGKDFMIQVEIHSMVDHWN